MKTLIPIAAMLLSLTGVPERQRATVETETFEGYVVDNGNWWMGFGAPRKEFWLAESIDLHRDRPLCFDSLEMYREVELHTGQAVDMQVVPICRGSQYWLLVKGVKAK